MECSEALVHDVFSRVKLRTVKTSQHTARVADVPDTLELRPEGRLPLCGYHRCVDPSPFCGYA
jgi:hypothetical protein